MKKKKISVKSTNVIAPPSMPIESKKVKIVMNDPFGDIITSVRTTKEVPKPTCYCCEKEINPDIYDNCYQIPDKRNQTILACKKCYNDKNIIGRCDSCGNMNLKQNLTEGFCSYCIQNAHKTVLRSYQTKAEQIYAPRISIDKSKFVNKEFSAEKYGNLSMELLGVELEYETHKNYGLSIIKYSKLTKGMAVVKRDSSLVQGFEVVSLPADKQSHYEMWKPFFDEMSQDANVFCADFNPQTEKGCGCHIHISKDMFMQGGQNNQAGLAVAKLVTFIHTPNNRNFIEIIAGRKSNMFCNFHTEKGVQFKNGRPIKTVGIKDAFYTLNHRTAVNLHTSNGKTIEFRFFRSTKDIEELYKNIDFVCALCNYCKPSVASVSQMSDWVFFHEFVLKNRQDYPYLYKFFTENQDFLAMIQKHESKFAFMH